RRTAGARRAACIPAESTCCWPTAQSASSRIASTSGSGKPYRRSKATRSSTPIRSKSHPVRPEHFLTSKLNLRMATRIAPFCLTAVQVDFFHSEGYLVLPGLFSAAEIASLASEAQTLLEREDLIDVANIRCRWTDHVASGQCLFDCF